MKKYSEFISDLNESSGKNYVDVFDANKPFKPVYQTHKSEIMDELKNLIDRKNKGILKSVIVFADIPTVGSRKPAYLADVLPPVKRTRTPEDRPEGDEPDEKNVFVDVEFEVIDLDSENNKIVGIPFSLKRKNLTTPIDPQDVIEISFHRTSSPESLPFSKERHMATNRGFTGGDKFIPSDVPEEDRKKWMRSKGNLEKDLE